MQTDTQGSLNEKFGNFGAAPGAELWDSIAAALDEDKRRRGAIWWWMLGAAAGVTLLFTIYRIGYNAGVNEMVDTVAVNQEQPQATGIDNNNLNDKNTASAIVTDTQNGNNSTDESNVADVAAQEEKNQVVADQSVNEKQSSPNDPLALQKAVVSDEVIEHKQTDKSNHAMPDVVVNRIATENEHATKVEMKKLPATGIFKPGIFTEPLFNAEPLAAIEKKQDRNLWRMGVSISRSTYIDNGVAEKPVDNELLDTYSTSSWANGIVASGNTISAYDADVRRPLVGQLTISRSLGRRWTLESGIGMAFMNSKLYYDIPDNTLIYQNSAGLSSVKSKHIGLNIPLHLSFDFIKRRRVECYAGVGLSNEFPLYRSSTPSYASQLISPDPVLESSGPSKQIHFDYQGAIQYNVGCRWVLNENLKLDLRPNLKYYFNEGSQVPTIGKAWFGATAGLTWAL